jgi:hypothetical protein
MRIAHLIQVYHGTYIPVYIFYKAQSTEAGQVPPPNFCTGCLWQSHTLHPSNYRVRSLFHLHETRLINPVKIIRTILTFEKIALAIYHLSISVEFPSLIRFNTFNHVTKFYAPVGGNNRQDLRLVVV